MTSPQVVRVPILDSSDKIPDTFRPDSWATVTQVQDLITNALSAFSGGGSIPTDVQSQLDSKASIAQLSSTPTFIHWVGPSWSNRPADSRPIIWIGGPSSPPATGSTAGGPGMAPIDIWFG